jgi:glycosyltransferase involved in cell wall biosynthesis
MSIWKGHLELVRALAQVKETHPNFVLLVVGTDDPRSAPGRPPLSEELKPLIRELGLEDQVILAGWRSDTPDILAALDIYAMPTFEEPCAVAFLEAMAMCKPIVALDSGGTPEIVPDGIAGLLAPVGDIEGLADRIRQLVADEGLRKEMGARGRQHVLNTRNARQMAKDAARIYDDLLSPSNRRSAGREKPILTPAP